MPPETTIALLLLLLLRLRDQIKAQLEKLQTCFDDLTKKQSDALTRPLDKLLGLTRQPSHCAP